jgi:hypothetical protein
MSSPLPADLEVLIVDIRHVNLSERRRSSFAAVAGILLDHNEKGEPLILAASSSVLIKSLADKESHGTELVFIYPMTQD